MIKGLQHEPYLVIETPALPSISSVSGLGEKLVMVVLVVLECLVGVQLYSGGR